jgi:hypothetical protein
MSMRPVSISAPSKNQVIVVVTVMNRSQPSQPESRNFMAGDLIVFPSSPDAEEHANAETKRKRALFQWTDGVLKALGLADLVARANRRSAQGLFRRRGRRGDACYP